MGSLSTEAGKRPQDTAKREICTFEFIYVYLRSATNNKAKKMKQQTFTNPLDMVYAPAKWVAYYRGDTRKKAAPVGLILIKQAALRCGAIIVAEYQEQECDCETARVNLGNAVADALRRRAVLVMADSILLTFDINFVAELVFCQQAPIKILNLPDIAMEDKKMFKIFCAIRSNEEESAKKHFMEFSDSAKETRRRMLLDGFKDTNSKN